MSQRVAADREHTARHVRDLVELLPPNIDRFNLLFLTAVQGSALETADRLGLAAAKDAAGLNFRGGTAGGMGGRNGRGERSGHAGSGRRPGASSAGSPGPNWTSS